MMNNQLVVLFMFYLYFLNTCEIIGGSVDTKLNNEVVLLDFVDQNCNCSRASKVQELKCAFGGKCRNKCIIYKSTCATTGKYYIDMTQQNFKNLMSGHFSDV